MSREEKPALSPHDVELGEKQPNSPPPAYNPAYPNLPQQEPTTQPLLQGQPVTQQPQPQVVIMNPNSAPYNFSTSPVMCQCPHCNAEIVTKVDYENGWLTWILVAVTCCICFYGLCFLGLIPLCVNACKDTKHSCPSCNQYLGVSKRIGH